MKLRGWHIDGFGIFRDVGVDDIADGVTVFLGPNESGKTTLLEFLRRMLFGFPDRRKRVNLYEPLRGGRHGGRVFVEGDEGVYTIERYSGHAGARRAFRITRPDGGEGGEEDLSRLLGGVDEKLFCNIFAFGLAELTRLDTLAGQEIRERITSAGISGAGAPAAEALKELQAMQVSILRSGRRTPSQSSLMRRDDSINGVVECLKETIRQREEAEGLARRYRELLEAESEISERIESLERQIEKARLRAEAADRATSLALRRLSGALGDFEAAVDKALYACTKAVQQQRDAEREIEAYSPRPIPRWVPAACWALALALAVISALKFTHGNPGAGVIAAMLSALALGTGLLARWVRARTAREERIRAERIERLRVRLNDSKQEFAGFVSDLWPLYCTVEESARAPELCGRADCSADFSALKEVLESVERALSGEPYDLTEAAKSLKWLRDEISRLRHNEEAYLQFRRNEEVDALISNLERERDQAIGDRREIENERKKLEVSSRLAELALQESALRAQLAQMVREWRINALAQGLLREALSEYERTRQPAVLEIASNNFRTITQGRYDRVVQSGGGAFEVVTSGGERLGVEALSRGTQEQLYLSLRLGLALDFARRAVFLPLIMDDVLVDFDPGRARATASLLASLSGELQVLFFTCHPDTAGLISATVPGSRVILMDYGARPDP